MSQPFNSPCLAKNQRSVLFGLVAYPVVFGALYILASAATGFPLYWTTALWQDALWWVGGFTAVATLLRVLLSGLSHLGLAVALVGFLLWAGGAAALAVGGAVALWVLSAAATGRGVLALLFSNRAFTGVGWSATALTGLAVQLSVFGVLIHLPVNDRALYLALLLAPVAAMWWVKRRAFIGQPWATVWRGQSALLQALPYRYWCLLVMAAGTVALCGLFPTVGYDDNAQHLRMWTQLASAQVYSFDVLTHIWEIAPFALSLLHAVVSLGAGFDARGMLNMALLALLLRQLWVLAGAVGLGVGFDRVLVLVLFLSTPMLGNLMLSLQTELLLSLLTAAGVRLVLAAPAVWWSPHLVALLAVSALCCATKLPGAVLGLLLLIAFAMKIPRAKPMRFWSVHGYTALGLCAFLAVLAVLAFNAYATAWWVTGNPVFPLYNGVFNSPFFDAVNFSDGRWVKGFGLQSFWGVFFSTSEFFESKNFVAGFQYLVLLPLGSLWMVFNAQLRKYWVVLLVLYGFGVVMFSATQYWRYMFPVLPLASVVVGVLLVQSSAQSKGVIFFLSASRAAMLACVVLNVYFYPGISWLFTTDAHRLLIETGPAAVTVAAAPAKALTDHVNTTAPGSRVLYPEESPFGATLRGQPIYVNWYSPARTREASAIKDGAGAADFLHNHKVDYVIWNTKEISRPRSPQWLMREHLSRIGVPLQQINGHVLYGVATQEVMYRSMYDLVRPETPTMALETPRVLATVTVLNAEMARYRAVFRCEADDGYLIAQVNWNLGEPYYRLVPCSKTETRFSESVRVPAGATMADVYLTVKGVPKAHVSGLTLEMD